MYINFFIPIKKQIFFVLCILFLHHDCDLVIIVSLIITTFNKKVDFMHRILLDFIGKFSLSICTRIGIFIFFLKKVFECFFYTRLDTKKLFFQMERIGVDSLFITLLTGFFSGAVLALQMYYGFNKFGTENMIGPIVAITLTRELAPVLTALMVTGRCGSSITAEIGTMVITEQVDALTTLHIDVYRYLVAPRILGTIVVLPFLSLFNAFIGILGGYIVYVYYFHLNAVDYIDGIKEMLEGLDIIGGMIKAAVFGFILASVGTYKGLFTHGGAKGVGIATTQAVVMASISILITNYFLAMLIFEKV